MLRASAATLGQLERMHLEHADLSAPDMVDSFVKLGSCLRELDFFAAELTGNHAHRNIDVDASGRALQLLLGLWACGASDPSFAASVALSDWDGQPHPAWQRDREGVLVEVERLRLRENFELASLKATIAYSNSKARGARAAGLVPLSAAARALQTALREQPSAANGEDVYGPSSEEIRHHRLQLVKEAGLIANSAPGDISEFISHVAEAAGGLRPENAQLAREALAAREASDRLLAAALGDRFRSGSVLELGGPPQAAQLLDLFRRHDAVQRGADQAHAALGSLADTTWAQLRADCGHVLPGPQATLAINEINALLETARLKICDLKQYKFNAQYGDNGHAYGPGVLQMPPANQQAHSNDIWNPNLDPVASSLFANAALPTYSLPPPHLNGSDLKSGNATASSASQTTTASEPTSPLTAYDAEFPSLGDAAAARAPRTPPSGFDDWCQRRMRVDSSSSSGEGRLSPELEPRPGVKAEYRLLKPCCKAGEWEADLVVNERNPDRGLPGRIRVQSVRAGSRAGRFVRVLLAGPDAAAGLYLLSKEDEVQVELRHRGKAAHQGCDYVEGPQGERVHVVVDLRRDWREEDRGRPVRCRVTQAATTDVGAAVFAEVVDPGANPSVSSPPASHNSKTVPCAFFRKGTCRNGTSCPFSHNPNAVVAGPKFKTQLCEYFALKRCFKGRDCPYAHGEKELKQQLQGAAPVGPGSKLIRREQ